MICDDGSPDDLTAALGSLRDQVTIIRKANGGFASAMNGSIDAAAGDFVVQLDADDAFWPRRLEAIEALISERPDLDIVATDASIEYGGQAISTFSASLPFQDHRQRTGIIERCFFAWPAIRRSRLLAMGGYDSDFKHIADWECHCRLILAGAVAGFVDEELYRYRIEREGLLSNRVAAGRERMEMLRKALEGGRLSPDERVRAEAAVKAQINELVRLEAHAAVIERRSDARRRSLAVLVTPGYGPNGRAKAALALVSPPMARHLASRRACRDPGAEALARRGFRRSTGRASSRSSR